MRPGEAPLAYVARVALEKAVFAHALLKRRHLTPRPVLTADTTVTIDGHILGKPANVAEATAMLNQLSGRAKHLASASLPRDGPAGHEAFGVDFSGDALRATLNAVRA